MILLGTNDTKITLIKPYRDSTTAVRDAEIVHQAKAYDNLVIYDEAAQRVVWEDGSAGER